MIAPTCSPTCRLLVVYVLRVGCGLRWVNVQHASGRRSPPNGQAVRAVLFDLYDTLAKASWLELETELAGRMGVHVEDVRNGYQATRLARQTGQFESTHLEMWALAEACGVTPTPQLITDLVEMESEFLTSVSLFEDAVPTLRRLREADVATALVSNCPSTTAPVVERLGLYQEVDLVVMSFEVGAAKPSAAIYKHALDSLGVHPNEALFVDDQLDFLNGARRLGIATAQMVHFQARNHSPSTGDHLVLRQLAGLESRV